MDNKELYLITSKDGYTPNISRLVGMMNYARYTTVKSVEGLTVDQLDYLIDDSCNSIGALLLHIAAVDYYYRTVTMEDRKPTKEELAFWEPALALGDSAREKIKGHPLSYYLDLLHQERTLTLLGMKSRDDSWLEIQKPFDGKPSNIQFRWFHVMEDEINHRGQIRWMAKRIKQLCC
ncbi:integrase [Paenibacillus sambharensis]|uniref:Integrase n=1 Tax=Paenibacillus sambharensis TaxID=1803190 RepID=A0A2W1LF54_9BACL|nr:DinB family protein [Paenibacillus sambharensis]PZD97319.1 integrase [Paenibacillus sambharensis]